MFLHRVKNIEHNVKQNICTGMEVISLFQKLIQKVTKKNPEYESILHN